MSFPPSTSFLPEQEAAVLLPDLARVCRQLGVQFVRASVVDVHTLAYQAAWLISETGDIAPTSTDRAMDSAFPGAASAISSLADAEPEQTLVHKQSPRRWAFAWALDERLAVVAEVQYRERRDTVEDIDRVMVRLLCSASVRSQAARDADAAPAQPAQVWPHVERRARPALSLAAWLAPLLALLAAVLATWAALVLLPQARQAAGEQRARADGLRSMADATLAHSLSTALSTGDYGEVQNALTQFQVQGYFRSAVVVNDKSLVVALAGPAERLRIGEPVSGDYAGAARPVELTLGPSRQGQLLLVSAPPPPAAPLDALQAGMAASAGLALLAALLLGVQLRSLLQRRRR